MTEAPVSRRDPRARAQRNRILAAAQACFAERGFHAASMAMIAEAAQMSPGLIYRYFDGKSDIIRGIVEQQLEWMAVELDRSQGDRVPLSQRLFEMYYREGARACDAPGLDPGLVMEISAEAVRDPVIGDALREFDETVQARLEAWLRAPVAEHGLGLPEDMAVERALLLRIIIDGLTMRQPRQPTLDPALLRRALAEVLTPLVGKFHASGKMA